MVDLSKHNCVPFHETWTTNDAISSDACMNAKLTNESLDAIRAIVREEIHKALSKEDEQEEDTTPRVRYGRKSNLSGRMIRFEQDGEIWEGVAYRMREE